MSTVIETPVRPPTIIHKSDPKKERTKVYKLDPNKRLQTNIVDQIVLIDSLKVVREQLVDTLKAEMILNKAKYADGDIATAQLNQSVDNSEILVEKFHQLLVDGKITKADYFKCLNVGKTEAYKVLGQDQARKISKKLPPAQPALRPERKKTAPPVKLMQVLEKLAPVVSNYETATSIPIEMAHPNKTGQA